VRSSRSGMSGINHPVKNLNRDPRQANKRLSQQNLPNPDIEDNGAVGRSSASSALTRCE
jgi:hypothetical protein